MNDRLVALTGATGFLGRHLVLALADQGWRIRVLARRDVIDPLWRDIEPEVVIGDLGDSGALARLCAGAEVVIHAAGLIKARSPGAFERANVAGTRQVAEAAARAGGRFIQISSLSAREPALSDYAASKHAGETAARAVIGEALTVVRPPAIYGPGDAETVRLFQAAAASPVLPLLAPEARIAVVHVEDAARQVAALAASPTPGTFALSDARPDGYSWTELMTAAAVAVGTRPRLVRIPEAALSLGAAAAALAARLSGEISILTPGKARELRHRDWSIRPQDVLYQRAPPRFALETGFAHSVQWYRANGWLNEKKIVRIAN